MAVVAVKGTQITNRDATPRVLVNAALQSGRLRSGIGSAVITSGDSATSTYRIIGGIPSNAFVRDVIVDSPDIGTTTTADVGLYRSTADGGAVVDADFFASAASLSGGALSRSNVTHESGVFTLAKREQPLWEALGLTSDPGVEYDLVLTLVGAADATGTAQVEIRYV